MKPKQMVGHDEIMKFVAGLYNGDLHAKRVLSLANATLGVLASASLAVHAIGQGLAQAMGTLSSGHGGLRAGSQDEAALVPGGQ